MKGSLFGPGTIVLGGGAVLLTVVLLIGFLLPTEWSASAEARLSGSLADVMPYLDSPEGWARWTTWPDSGLTRSGPDRGEGARISWDDRELGAGSFTIVGVGGAADEGLAQFEYEVVVDGAANTLMTTHGTIVIEAFGTETLVSWNESGDLGRNPLMGFWAFSMEKAQAAEMEKSLNQLAEAVSSASAPTR